MIKAKTISIVSKMILAAAAVTFAVLKWTGVLPDCSVSEICAVTGAAYGIVAGTVDANITVDKFRGVKIEPEPKTDVPKD